MWHINLEKNEVVINKKIAKELFHCGAQVCSSWEMELLDESDAGLINCCVGYRDKDNTIKLYFNPDHMEWMDYVWEEKILAVLKKHKVKGDICFSSNDGDNKGEKWGYRFDGKGKMIKLNGTNGWKEVKSKRK